MNNTDLTCFDDSSQSIKSSRPMWFNTSWRNPCCMRLLRVSLQFIVSENLAKFIQCRNFFRDNLTRGEVSNNFTDWFLRTNQSFSFVHSSRDCPKNIVDCNNLIGTDTRILFALTLTFFQVSNKKTAFIIYSQSEECAIITTVTKSNQPAPVYSSRRKSASSTFLTFLMLIFKRKNFDVIRE